MRIYVINNYVKLTAWQRFLIDVKYAYYRLRINMEIYKLCLKLKWSKKSAYFYSYSTNRVITLQASQIKKGFVPWTVSGLAKVPGHRHSEAPFQFGENYWISVRGYIHYLELL